MDARDVDVLLLRIKWGWRTVVIAVVGALDLTEQRLGIKTAKSGSLRHK